MPKVINWKQVPISIYKIIECLNSIFYIIKTSKLFIHLKFKVLKHGYLFKTILVIINWKNQVNHIMKLSII